jgi:DNA-binding IclR family transcriptional regulator
MKMVKSLLKAIDVLELVSSSDKNLTPSQIAAGSAINRATAYRLLRTWESRGYLAREKDTNRYEIGLKFLPIAAKLLNSTKLRVESLPHLQNLANKCGERVNLAVLYEGEVLYLAGVDKPSLPATYSLFGQTPPAHCCSLGKVMLAHMSEEEVDYMLDQKPLIKLTENTITDRGVFKQHLAEIRSQGYAVDNQEYQQGLYCIAVLLRGSDGHGIGAISLSSRDLEKIKGQLSNLTETAEIVSYLNGYTLL